jgi:hypothetical protein
MDNIQIPLHAWIAFGLVLGTGVLAQVLGYIWLRITTEPKPKPNKLDKKGKSNG